MIHLFFTFFLLFSDSSFGLEALDAKKITSQIDLLSDLSPQDYYTQIDTLRESIEKFLSLKKKVCQGEYSPFVLGQDSKTKFDEKDKRQCFKELRSLHVDYIENVYKARKRYLEFSHKQRLDELLKHKEQAIKNLK